MKKNFVFIHLPKTGGYTTLRVLQGAKLWGNRQHSHAGLNELEIGDQSNPRMFTNIREPLAWYRSYLHYNMQADGTASTIIAPFLTNGRLELDTAMQRMAKWYSMPQRGRLLGIRGFYDTDMCKKIDIGPYTWMVLNQLRRAPLTAQDDVRRLKLDVPHLVDTSQLRTGLKQLMDSWGHPIDNSLETVPDDNCNADLVAQGRTLMPFHTELHELSSETVEMVYDAERYVASLMGYNGPNSLAKTPVVSREI